jgi:hypothetical protein
MAPLKITNSDFSSGDLEVLGSTRSCQPDTNKTDQLKRPLGVLQELSRGIPSLFEWQTKTPEISPGGFCFSYLEKGLL